MGSKKTKRPKEDQELFTLDGKDAPYTSSLKKDTSDFLRNAKIIESIYGCPPVKAPVMKKEALFGCFKDTNNGGASEPSTKLKRKATFDDDSSEDEAVLDEEGQAHLAQCLTQAIQIYFDIKKPGEKVLGIRRNFFADLETQTRNLFPECELVLFGSSVTGLAEAESDLDVCLLTPDPENDSPLEYLGRLQRVIRKIARVHFIKSASVPILACVRQTHSSTFDFDISCNRPEGLWNAQIVKHFIEMDSRIAPCLFFLHKLFNTSGIKNSKCALLSSFSINISFLSYLQHNFSLPRVHWSISDQGEMLVNYVQFKSAEDPNNTVQKCTKSEGELVVGYLNWMVAEIISPGTRYLDIRHPSDQDTTIARPSKNLGFGIINPTVPTHDVTKNIGERQWKIILSGIRMILSYLTTEVTCAAEADPQLVGPAAAQATKGVGQPSKKAKRFDKKKPKAKNRQKRQQVIMMSPVNGSSKTPGKANGKPWYKRKARNK